MSERIRSLTANQSPGQPFSAEFDQQLAEIKGQVQTYLLSQDPVRRFTRESLQAQLEAHRQSGQPLLKRHPVIGLVGVWVVALVAFLVGFSIPLPFSVADRAQLAQPLFFIGLHTGIAWFYLSSLRNFTQQLRQAYVWIVVAVVITGLGAGQFTPELVFHLYQSVPLLHYGGFFPVFTLACLFFYMGMRIFALQVGVTSRWLSWRLIGTSAVVMVLVTVPVGMLLNPPFQWAFDLAMGSALVQQVLVWPAALLAFKTAARTTTGLAVGLKWLGVCLAGVGLGALQNALLFLIGIDLSNGLPFYGLAIFM
ncbi:MAG TPA: hypothetical protein VLF67_02220, partial [Candidatus Saccharimonas sp.]|nr:hypothetical protein [Candidatus Saccharimonas sp.]